MRIPGPRTLIRYMVLISIPSVVLLIYIFTQTLPLAIRAGITTDQLIDLPVVRIIPHLSAEPLVDDHVISIGDQLRPLSVDPERTGAGGAPLRQDPDGGFAERSDNLTERRAGAWNTESNYELLRSNTAGDVYDEGVEYKMATTEAPELGVQDVHILGTQPADPDVPSQREIEQYLMDNYRANVERGKSRFSLDVTESMIEQGPLDLPELLPNLEVPCWVEDLPTDFTYRDNIYHCHINNRRIKAGFDAMLTYYDQRQQHSGFRWRIRCLPSFYLIGVAKCGTTDLFEALTRHPQVLRPDLKEPEFWPYLRFGLHDLILNMTCARDKGRATFAEYLDTFDLTAEMVTKALRKDDQNTLHAKVHFGDYSTHTFIDIFDWDKTLEAPDKINADHIYNVWPKSKFIIILRDPIDRAYSRYKMRLARQDNVAGTPSDFHKRVLKQVSSTTECLQQHSRRYCVYKASYGVGNQGTNALLNTGLYAIYLKDWLRVFPLNQFLIIEFEDYIHNRTRNIENIAAFLGMDPLPPPHRSIIDSMTIMNPGRDIGGVLPETRQALQEFYRPFNAELVEILGDRRFHFGY